MQLIKLGIVIGLASMLVGCGTNRPGSVLGGECRVFNAPLVAVEGKTKPDQYWIDDTIESGVAACGWHRPKAKPKAKPPPKKKVVKATKVEKPKVVEVRETEYPKEEIPVLIPETTWYQRWGEFFKKAFGFRWL